jgi:hypothetical protein
MSPDPILSILRIIDVNIIMESMGIKNTDVELVKKRLLS